MSDFHSFEDGLRKLDEIITQLEKGDLPLEKAVDLYGQGTVIASSCKNELDNAKLNINEISIKESHDNGSTEVD